MSVVLPQSRRFSFASRPVPVPGDLRINWRVSLILVMLGVSRSNRASLAKLHVLNYAARSTQATSQLQRILLGTEPTMNWQMRVEPAFARAVNFVIGDQLAGWIQTAQRTGLQLTKVGIDAWKRLDKADGVLEEEKLFLREVGRKLTEEFVSRLLHMRRD
jgi:hypothetical protein